MADLNSLIWLLCLRTAKTDVPNISGSMEKILVSRGCRPTVEQDVIRASTTPAPQPPAPEAGECQRSEKGRDAFHSKPQLARPNIEHVSL